MTVGTADERIGGLVDDLDVSTTNYALASAVHYSETLHGEDVLDPWRRKVSSYPKRLAIKIVQENLWFGPWFFLEAYTHRDELLALNQNFIWSAQCTLRILAALNRTYVPSSEFKWMDHLIERMEIKPRDLSGRIMRLLRSSSDVAAREFTDLINSTIDLVEEHLPEVNTIPLFDENPEAGTEWARQHRGPRPPYTLIQAIAGEDGEARTIRKRSDSDDKL